MLRKAALVLLLLPALVQAQTKPEIPSDKPFVPGKRWAIVVGASEYLHYSQLSFADDDARAFSAALVNDFGFEPGNVRLLCDGGDRDRRTEPSSGNIIGEVEDILAGKTLDKGDLFIFYFSGHGVGTPKGDYLLPTDAREASAERVGLPVAEVISRFVEAGLKNVLIVADACRSGKKNPFGAALLELGRKSNMAVILGSEPGGRSYEAPALKHSVFTYHLLEAMRDPANREPSSGALWASAVAKAAKEHTSSYSERDYGDDKQVPAVWGSAADDVLLGAYPPADLSKAGIEDFKKQAEGLTTPLYESAMSQYADQLFDADRYRESVEVLRTLDRVKPLAATDLYTLAVALYLCDRTRESFQAHERLRNGPDSYWKQLSLATDSSNLLKPAERLQAAEAMWKSEPSWSTAFLAWTSIKRFAKPDRKKQFVKEALDLSLLTPKQKAYLQAEAAALEGSFAKAAELMEKAADGSSTMPSDDLLYVLAGVMLQSAHDFAGYAALIERRLKDKEVEAFWYLEKAERQKVANDKPAMMEWLKKALAAKPDPGDLLRALTIAGAGGAGIVDEVVEAAKRHPFSWQAILASTFATSLRKGEEGLLEAINEGAKYCEDDVAYVVTAFDLYNGIMTDLVSLEALEPIKQSQFCDMAFLGLSLIADKWGRRPDAWFAANQYGGLAERQMQLAKLADKLLGSTASGDALLDCTLQIIYGNMSDTAKVEALAQSALITTLAGMDAKRMWAVYLAYQGRFAEASAVIGGIPKADSDFQPNVDALMAWCDAELGKNAEARKRLETLGTTLPFGEAMAGLAWAKLGDWEKAEPLLEKSRQLRSWGYMYVHARGCHALAKRYMDTKRPDLLAEMAYEAGLSQPGSPTFARFGFSADPKVSDFEGKHDFSVLHWNDRQERGSGELKLTVGVGGEVSGDFVSEKGDRYSVKGKVDEFGNLSGTVVGKGTKWTMEGKLAPLPWYAKVKRLTEVGTPICLYDEKIFRWVWVAKPALSAGG
ncbi:MAG: hypothetical protein HONBIEJF_00581 [Fimbriimonadaceae bacterium]|nr:hypothetical protein [Fimbriimonadaceae bacterium]